MTAPARSGRALLGACAGLAAAAALLWGGSAASWYRVTPPGRSTVVFDGASVHPWLTGLALLALAGVAGLVAVAGFARRAVAALLGLAGAATAGRALLDLVADPFAAGAPASGLPRLPAGLSAEVVAGASTSTTAAPLLAVAGGLAMVAVAGFVLVREPRLARFGARYAAPGPRAPDPDPDRAAWAALDEGSDPTADPATPTATGASDPDDGRRGGAV